jgi:membrane-bound lytic murein transglycosylase D
MESIFAKSNLPTELVRLPLVESSFNEKAVSKVGASGIWQFMPVVGKHYLKMTEPFDERNSPIKATEAAARLLRSNFSILKSWPLAITAYNHGASGVLKAMKKVKSEEIDDLIENYSSRSFSFASKNFYSEFMAALYAERYQDEIFGHMPKLPPLAEDRVTLIRPMHLRDLSEIAGVTMEEIKLHNPDIKSKGLKENAVLPKGYKIHLPLGSGPGLELYFQK